MSDVAVTITRNDVTVTPTATGVAVTVAPASVAVTTTAGSTSFLGLFDTPNDYTGQGGKVVAVKSDVSGLEFTTVTGGVSDHGTLTGLSDDDHLQYHTDARGDARYWTLATDLATQAELDAAFVAHLTALDPHPGYLTPVEGNAAYSALAHTHVAADVVSGLFAGARIAAGTPDGTKFLRDDQVWAVPPSAAIDGSGIAGRIASWTDTDTLQAANLIGPASNVLTLAAGGAFTLTVPATGTAALLGTNNLFTVRQDIRASGSALAAGLFVPWITGDTLPAVRCGDFNGNRTGINALSGSSNGVYAQSNTGTALLAESSSSTACIVATQLGTAGAAFRGSTLGGLALYVIINPSSTNTVIPVLQIDRETSGTGANGIGASYVVRVEDSAGTLRAVMTQTASLPNATSATATGRYTLSVADFAASREVFRAEATGTAAALGLYGGAAVTQKAAITAPTGGATIDAEARTAIGLILTAIGAAAGGIGITA